MENPLNKFAAVLQAAVEPIWPDCSDTELVASISYPEQKFGHFSTNLAFRLSGKLKSKPAALAEKIITKLQDSELIENVQFVEPGFINVRLKATVWSDYIASLDQDFINRKLEHSEKIQLEFISANPTGPLVLTNAWQGYYGDILANIYASQGYAVQREYYLNDGGNQISALGKAIQHTLGAEFAPEVTENLYRGEYIDNCAEIITTKYGNKAAVLAEKPATIGKVAAEIIIEQYIKSDLARLDVKFDSMYSESKPDIKATLKRLESSGLLIEKEGAIWLNGSKAGLSQDEVLVRSYDKGYTYFLKDIAYQLERLEKRGFDKTITIVGPDHHGQAIRLINTLRALGHEGFSEISTQTIRLIKDGKEFKMSKRKGNYILLSDFLDSVPSEAARFYFAMRDTNTHLDFDIDLVREHSSKNPVYYALYAYARACSIQKKATELGLQPAGSLKAYEASQNEIKLAIEISKIPATLLEITRTHKVHHLLHQTIEVAKAFHEYYERERVLTSPEAAQKLLIIQLFKSAYEALFGLIGVSLLQEM